jgi:hypothetical protein
VCVQVNTNERIQEMRNIRLAIDDLSLLLYRRPYNPDVIKELASVRVALVCSWFLVQCFEMKMTWLFSSPFSSLPFPSPPAFSLRPALSHQVYHDNHQADNAIALLESYVEQFKKRWRGSRGVCAALTCASAL